MDAIWNCTCAYLSIDSLMLNSRGMVPWHVLHHVQCHAEVYGIRFQVTRKGKYKRASFIPFSSINSSAAHLPLLCSCMERISSLMLMVFHVTLLLIAIFDHTTGCSQEGDLGLDRPRGLLDGARQILSYR